MILFMTASASPREQIAPIRWQLAGSAAYLLTLERDRGPIWMVALNRTVFDEIAMLVVDRHSPAERLEDCLHGDVLTEDQPLVQAGLNPFSLILLHHRVDV